MTRRLSYDLHKLTARLDRAADRVLRHEMGTTYARFLALFALSQGAQSQRELAAWLGVTEPSASRMTAVLAADGLLTVTREPGAGNRRTLTLTQSGQKLAGACGRLLEHRFADLMERSGVPYGVYERYTQRLIAQIEADETPMARSA
jgi:DNA-binding MarR family transcriptional regulator